MNRRLFRQHLRAMVLASGFAAACSGESSPQTAPPAACTAGPLSSNPVLPDPGSPTTGTVTGSEITARMCDGGTFAHGYQTSASPTPPSPLRVTINSYTADPTLDYSIARPADATRLRLSVDLGPSAAEPGTYTEISSPCGFIELCAVLPVPASAFCAPPTDVCPVGCTFAPPHTTCVPVEPTTCWQASAAVLCNGASSTEGGSWRLTLSSAEPSVDTDGSGNHVVVVHGTLDATLVKTDSGGTASSPPNTATLSLSF